MDKLEKMKVLFAVWELEPFLKVGGLGVVARSLPTALHKMGVDISVVIPYYKAINFHRQRKEQIGTLLVPYGQKTLKIKVYKIYFLNSQIPVYLLHHKRYLDKPIIETFAVFAAAVVSFVEAKMFENKSIDIVHCNDNHCGLIPLLLKVKKINVKTLLTIHCVSHQRKLPMKHAINIGIPEDQLSLARWESPAKQLNYLLEGITHADYVNTVSPTYLKEIQTEEEGDGLDDVVRQNIGKTSAILNGLDYELCNPETNGALAVNYVIDGSKLKDPIKAKKINKAQLQKRLGLPINPKVTLIAFIGRFDVRQKGIDVLHRMLWREQFDKCQFVIMGHGQESWEDKFVALSTFLPKIVVVMTKYDDDLASLIYAGSDYVLIPSHFEPCCLIQMQAMRYGSIPIARATGGLNDTIIDGENGLLYQSPTAGALKAALEKAIKIKLENRQLHEEMIGSAMRTNFSWDRSAKEYVELYRKMLS